MSTKYKLSESQQKTALQMLVIAKGILGAINDFDNDVKMLGEAKEDVEKFLRLANKFLEETQEKPAQKPTLKLVN